MIAGRAKINELIKDQEKVLQDTKRALNTPKQKSWAKVTGPEEKSNDDGPEPEDLQENIKVFKEVLQRNHTKLINARDELDTLVTQRAKLKSIKQKPVMN